jgi:hypothetical protein
VGKKWQQLIRGEILIESLPGVMGGAIPAPEAPREDLYRKRR